MRTRQRARQAVDKIVADLRDRRGLKHEWNSIDPDIQAEIRTQWERFIFEAFEGEALALTRMLRPRKVRT
jgi:hypothetical protein